MLNVGTIQVKLNSSVDTAAPLTPPAVMDWTSVDIVKADDSVYELTLSTRITRVAALITTLNLFDFVSASNGSIAYESTTIDVPSLGVVDGALTKIAITVGQASIGAGGIGITVTGGQLYVASIVSGTKSWRTIESSLTSGSLNGIEGLVLNVGTIQVKLNSSVDTAAPLTPPAVMDWTSVDIVKADDSVYELTLSTRITRVAALITTLNLFDFVSASNGSIAYESTTIDVPSLGVVDGALTKIAITVGQASIGAGGIGITVTGGQLYVASIVSGTKSWRTIESSLTSGSLNGIEGLVLNVGTIQVKLNSSVDTAAPLTPPAVMDWTSVDIVKADDSVYELTLSTRITRVAALITTLNLFDFVSASNGSIAYESTTIDVPSLGVVDGALTKIAITVGQASIGAGGIGITVTGGQLYVASIVSGTKSWRTIESSLTSGSLNGIEGLVLNVGTIQVKLNSSVDTAAPLTPPAVMDWTSVDIVKADDSVYELTLSTRITRVAALITTLNSVRLREREQWFDCL